MKKYYILLIAIFTISIAAAQEQFTEKQIKVKTDSILIEGNLLYQFEKSAWIATDLTRENKKVKKEFKSYFVYLKLDTIKTIILNKDNKCIYEYSFINNFDKPTLENSNFRDLNTIESYLIKIKEGIISNIEKNKQYEVKCPDGYELNNILIPIVNGYKFYLITGTSQNNIIPFGNDYLFNIDNDGSITSWKKFHSRLIATMTKGPDGEEVRGVFHSHLRTEPFISPTDICTFRLYGPLYKMNEFSVYSPALSKYMKYNIKKNNIEISDKP